MPRAQQWLEANPDIADEAVVAIDGYITVPPDPRQDAIILDIRGYRERIFQMRMAVPYRPHHDSKGRNSVGRGSTACEIEMITEGMLLQSGQPTVKIDSH